MGEIFDPCGGLHYFALKTYSFCWPQVIISPNCVNLKIVGRLTSAMLYMILLFRWMSFLILQSSFTSISNGVVLCRNITSTNCKVVHFEALPSHNFVHLKQLFSSRWIARKFFLKKNWLSSAPVNRWSSFFCLFSTLLLFVYPSLPSLSRCTKKSKIFLSNVLRKDEQISRQWLFWNGFYKRAINLCLFIIWLIDMILPPSNQIEFEQLPPIMDISAAKALCQYTQLCFQLAAFMNAELWANRRKEDKELYNKP